MKKLLLTAAATLFTVAAFAQGQVNFGNASSLAGWPDPGTYRSVYFTNATGLNPALVNGLGVGSNSAGLNLTSLRATLYYAASTVTDLALFQQAAVPAGATFKASTSATVGSWFNKTATLQTIGNGTTANLVVVVWDSSLSTDPLSAQAQLGLWGSSAIFTYTPPTSPTPAPAEFLMVNMRGFGVGIVPEPSTFALAGLGAAALLIFRRRK